MVWGRWRCLGGVLSTEGLRAGEHQENFKLCCLRQHLRGAAGKVEANGIMRNLGSIAGL